MTNKKPTVKVRHHTVLDIIQACKEAGVTSFRDGELEILFSSPNSAIIDKAPEKLFSPTTQAMSKEEQEFKIEPMEKSKDDVLFDLMVADPIAFEETMMKESDG